MKLFGELLRELQEDFTVIVVETTAEGEQAKTMLSLDYTRESGIYEVSFSLYWVKINANKEDIMGLDQFVFMKTEDDEKPEEVFYWRKHPNLHGWMEKRWKDKGRPNFDPESRGSGLSDFNCVQFELTLEDIEALEKDVLDDNLPETPGFFFGQSTPERKEEDLKFIAMAKSLLKEGKEIYYDSWW